MGSIIDRALDIINDHLKDQTSSFQVASPLAAGKAMARGGHVLEDDYPTHYLPEVGRQVMARGGFPRQPMPPMPELEDAAPPPQMGHNMPPEPTPVQTPTQTQPVPAAMDMGGLHPQIISQRMPTAVKSQEDPNDQALTVGLEAAKMHPKSFEHNVNLIKTYDHLRPEEMQGSHEEVAENFINHLKDNYLFLHDLMPEEQRARAKEWYVGANKFANRLAKEHRADPAAAAASIAAMSPQKDWFQNASLAERLFDIHHKAKDENYSHDMEMTANRIFGKEKFDELLDKVRGKTYGEVDDPRLKAIWARLYDETYHDPSHRLMTPEGVIGDWVKNQDGSNARVSWGSTSEIMKGIQALMGGATRERISDLMGLRHKIRNFYNNILDPHSPTQDVTVDTHAVAGALLEPLGANATQVSHNFKNSVQDGSPAAKGSAETGVQGTYPFYTEALRRAASERGIEPREMQSITWEGLKGLFPDTFKNDKNIAAVREIWKDYAAGNIDIDDARKKIVELAGGINEPAWSRSSSVPDEGESYSTYERKLSAPRIYGEAAILESRIGGANSGPVPGLEEPQLRSFQRNRELTRASRQAFGQEALPQSFSRRTGRVGKNNLETNFDAPARAVYDVTPEAQEAFSKAGIAAPSMVELASGAKGANAFHNAITESKKTNPLAASVHAYDPKEYKGMRLFMTPNGKAGFALKGDDIVSVFNSRDSGHTHVSNAMLQLAIAQGGRRLDAFDTALPHIYSRNKFRVVSRMPWNEEYKPEGWKHSDFDAYNKGKPDVVFMHYDPTYDQLYDGAQGARTDDYDQAVKMQSAGVKKAEGNISKLSKKPAKAYGGAINPVELRYDDLEDQARRLILWSYAAAPLVRPLSRAEGGSVDDPVNKALDIVGAAPSSTSAVDTARNLTPMGFYSAAAEAASKIPQRAPIDQIINKIKGQPNVKAAELDNANLADAFAGQRSVDPKEVARHLQENVPQIKERTYGGSPAVKYEPKALLERPKGFEDADDVYEVGPYGKPPHLISVKTNYDSVMPHQYAVHGPSGFHSTYFTLADAVEHANNSINNIEQPLYKEYTVPGGENYREVVMALPQHGGTKAQFRVTGALPDVFDSKEEAESYIQELRQKAERNPNIAQKLDRFPMNIVTENKPINEPYKSSHWMGIPNPLAHLRMSDRDNGKTLHLEELQSDWGQEGRKKGFKGELVKGYAVHWNGNPIASYDNKQEADSHVQRALKNDPNAPVSVSEIMASRPSGSSEEMGKLPSAPYVTDTNQWVDLGLKRALMEAAKGGYDKLVWTPGNEQAKRYDLSRKLSAVHWSPDSNHLHALDHDGYAVFNQKVDQKDLPDVIGKDLANKLVSTKPLPNTQNVEGDTVHSLIGGDLQVGGEGMKSFYDKLVPQRLSKLISQYDKDVRVAPHSHSLKGEDGEVRAHSIEITPKLRAAILKGLPAFKSGGDVGKSPIIDHAFKVLSKFSR